MIFSCVNITKFVILHHKTKPNVKLKKGGNLNSALVMKLLTKKIENQLKKYPLYSQDGKKDQKVICKFFYGSWTWYVLEGERREDGDFMFYGIVNNQYGAERGYFTLSQLESLKKFGYPLVERDLYFDGCKVSELDLEDYC